LSKPVQKLELINCLKDFLPIRKIASEITTAENVFSEVQLTDEELKHLSVLLHKQWLPRWESIKNSLVINELEAFASDLQALTQEYHLVTFQKYTQNLLNQISLFALDQIQETLSIFPELVVSILDDSTLI
jgi:hypothetical protein